MTGGSHVQACGPSPFLCLRKTSLITRGAVSSEALSRQPLTMAHSSLQDAVYFLFPPQAGIFRLDAQEMGGHGARLDG